MRFFLRLLPIILALLAALLSLFACSPASPKDDFSYAATPFSAAVRGTYTPEDSLPRPVTARITVGAPISGDDPTARPLTITFTEPPTLAGITVTAVYETNQQGQVTRIVTFIYPSTYGEVKTSSQAGDFDGFLRFAEALLPIGDITAISPVAEDGTHTVTRTTTDDKREAIFLFSAEQTLPLRITVKSESATIEFAVTP